MSGAVFSLLSLTSVQIWVSAFSGLSAKDVDQLLEKAVSSFSSQERSWPQRLATSIPLPFADFFCNSMSIKITEVRLMWETTWHFAVLHSVMYLVENIGKHSMNPVL